jgi:FkbM family methyltransferase
VKHLKIILSDARGIARACGLGIAVLWLWSIVRTFGECRRVRNLQPADRRMGDGPFRVHRAGARAVLTGTQVFSGIREIWVRDVYLKDDYLKIPPGACVVDLGANLGNFTSLALAQHPDVRVVAVEPSRTLFDSLERSLRLNGWSHRASVLRAFIGVETRVQVAVQSDENYRDVKYVTEADFIAQHDLRRIDFLKCDIEGSEFFLLNPDSRLLSMTEHLAIEIHPTGGSVSEFLKALHDNGFAVGSVVNDAGGACIALCKRVRVAPRPALRLLAS